MVVRQGTKRFRVGTDSGDVRILGQSGLAVHWSPLSHTACFRRFAVRFLCQRADPADVGRVQIGTFRQLLLRDPLTLSQLPNPLPQRRPQIVHGLESCREARRFAERGATICNPAATEHRDSGMGERRKWFRQNGEPPRNRTENPQIKSLLLCQLS